ncbi:MAG: right-handed parallel beta-helix repeat-containing protein, partial [Chromatiaceae bacterium]|nr:right-handed parallel beta-helix repeat-containing protein [Chromatiaceae bacterium]
MTSSRSHKFLFVVGLLALLSQSAPILADEFCINDELSLQNALIYAAGNGQDDHIKVVQGRYLGNFVYGSVEPRSIKIEGGYTQGCTGRSLNSANTVMDGRNSGIVMVIAAESSVTIEGISFTNGMQAGLQLEVSDPGSISIRYNNISDNAGSGIVLSRTRASLIGNNIMRNAGTGISATVSGTPIEITRNIVSGNGSGGIMLHAIWGVSVDLTGNQLINNTKSIIGRDGCQWVYGNGAGVFLDSSSFPMTLALVGNRVIGNTASAVCRNSSYSYGGGVYINNARDVMISNNTFSNNSTSAQVSLGGGLYVRALNLIFVNNTLQGNLSGFGGGLHLSLRSDSESANFYNNIFWRNNATGGEGDDLWIDNKASGDFIATPTTVIANNFNWQQPEGVYVRLPIAIDATNLNAVDPLFVDLDDGDFRLGDASPMIDAGYPNTPDLPEKDLYGKPRVIGGIVDIGAYEWQGFVLDECSSTAITVSNLSLNNGSARYRSQVNVTFSGTNRIDSDGVLTASAPVIWFDPGFSVARGGKFSASAQAVTCAASAIITAKQEASNTETIGPRLAEATSVVLDGNSRLPNWIKNLLVSLRINADDINSSLLDADGHWLVFETTQALVNSDANTQADIYRLDLLSHQRTLISATEHGQAGNGLSRYPGADASGELIVFHSEASDLVLGDYNQVSDIFVRDLALDLTSRLSQGEQA